MTVPVSGTCDGRFAEVRDEFVAGILMNRLIEDRSSDLAFRKRLGTLAPLMAVGAVTLFALFIAFSPGVPFLATNDGLLVPVYLLAIVAASAGSRPLDAVLGLGFLTLLGEASYGLYLLHVPLFAMWMEAMGPVTGWAYWVYLATTVGASVVLYLAFERPARRFLLRAAGRVRGSP